MTDRNTRWLLLLLVLGALGLTAFLDLYREAFPSAALDFRLSRGQAYAAAGQYLAGLGYDTETFRGVQVFGHDQEPQIFLERTLGLDEANRLTRDWLSIWSWRVRWFKPMEKEELQVRLDPGGRVVGFRHLILESDPGEHLNQEQARVLGEAYLRRTQGLDLDAYTLIERSSVEQKARTDHTFIYRRNGFTVGEDGHYRLEVTIQGDRIGSFREYLKVPEAFSRNYAEVRSRAALLTQIATVFWMGLGVVMLVILVRRFRQRDLLWRVGLVVGGAVVIASVAGQLNSLPLLEFGYQTTQAYGFFITLLLSLGVLGGLISGGIICLAGTAGESVGREVLHHGRRSPLGRFALTRLLAPGSARPVLAGYGLAACMLGYVTLFYLIGSRYFGVWSPAEVSDYDNAFSTLIPWIYPLLVGLSAATLEEFFFRLLAIPLLLRWLGRKWLAVLLPALVWGFLHANYPVEPIYTRGLELTVMGVILGVVFLRFGIWSTIIAHYAYDAVLVALPMLKSSSTYFQVSGMAVVGLLLIPALPALVGLVSKRARRLADAAAEPEPLPSASPGPTKGPTAELSGVAQTPAGETPVVAEVSRSAPMSDAPGMETAGVLELPGDPKMPASPGVAEAGQRPLPGKRFADYHLGPRARRMAMAFVLGGACLLAGGWQLQSFGERTLELSLTRSQAIQVAETFCASTGLELRDYQRTAWFTSDLDADPYVHLVRKAGIARADTLVTTWTAPWMWTVRWFRPEEKEEVRVGVDGSGQVAFFDHRVAEDLAGVDLEQTRARALAEAYLRTRFERTVTDTARFRLLESQAEKRTARTDHRFVWEWVEGKVEDGEFRAITSVQGDEVGRVQFLYKAPEAFLRELRAHDIKDLIPIMVIGVLGLASLILGGVFFFRAYADGLVRWGFPLRMGILATVLWLINRVNALPAFFRGYDTSQALGTFLGLQGIGLLMGGLFLALAVTVVVALGMALLRTLHPRELTPGQWLTLLRPGEGQARIWMEALLLVGALALWALGMGALDELVHFRWLTAYLKPDNYAPAGLNTYLPFVAGLSGGLQSVVTLCLALTLVLIWQRVLRRTWILVLGLGLVMFVMEAIHPAEDWYQFSILSALSLVGVPTSLWLITRLVRYHLLAYLIYLWGRDVLGSGWSLVHTASLFYQVNGAALFIVGLAPLLYPWLAYRKAKRGCSTSAD